MRTHILSIVLLSLVAVVASQNCGRCGSNPPYVQRACTKTQTYYLREHNPRRTCTSWWFVRHCKYVSTYTQKRVTRQIATPCCDGEMRRGYCYRTLYASCGQSKYSNTGERLAQIVGGTETQRHEFPWQVVVRQGTGLCGGTIISKNHVLTAAHCVDGSGLVRVIAGRHTWNRYEKTQQTRYVRTSNIKIHGSFNARTLLNDIGVLNLSIALKFNENVTSACLPPANANYVGKTAIISGWGRMGNGSIPSALRYTTVTVVQPSVCDRAFSGTQVNIICGSDGEGNRERSSCQGDSGGPMVIKQNGRFTVIGVASFVARRGCAVGFPFGYTDVSDYITWIRGNM